MLAAAAVQLTLGLEIWDISYFKEILIYPDEYRNPKTKLLYKGETNMGGFMCFSWKDFLLGFKNPTDKINLGLHEFTHALKFNGIRGDTTNDYFFTNYYDKWQAYAYKEYRRMQRMPSIFRKYGGVNINEFFSVAVETFFENPKEFKTTFPELYNQTAILLNQYTKDDGTVVVDCRKELMFKDTIENAKPLHTSLRRSGAAFTLPLTLTCVSLAITFMLGSIELERGFNITWYFIAITCFCYAWFDYNYAEYYFDEKHLKIKHGLLASKLRNTTLIPNSNIISAVGSADPQENSSLLKVSFTLTFYNDNDFMIEDLTCQLFSKTLTEFCKELYRINIHVFIRQNARTELFETSDLFDDLLK